MSDCPYVLSENNTQVFSPFDSTNPFELTSTIFPVVGGQSGCIQFCFLVHVVVLALVVVALKYAFNHSYTAITKY